MAESLSTFIACYNETATLERAVTEVIEAHQRAGRRYEVVLVDDGSTDGSGALADALAERLPQVRVIHHERNLGLGGFYRTAFREAQTDIVYFMAADLQPIPGEYFHDFLPLFDSHDAVVGYDLRREAPALSKLLSWGEKQIFAFLYPGVPKIGGPLMIRRRVIDAVDLALARDQEDRSWMVLWELVIRARRRGWRFARVPVRRRPRTRGRSRGSTIRTAAVMLSRLGQLRRALAGPVGLPATSSVSDNGRRRSP